MSALFPNGEASTPPPSKPSRRLVRGEDGEMRPETNIELVTRVCQFSRHGAMAQMFLVDALLKAAKKVAETPDEELTKAFGEHPFIHPQLWKATAREWLEELNTHLDLR